MSELPDYGRIWLVPFSGDDGSHTWCEHAVTEDAIEYVRADRAKQLEEALRPFAEAAREFTFSIGPDGKDDHLTIVARSVARDREAYLSTADFHRAAALLNGGSNERA